MGRLVSDDCTHVQVLYCSLLYTNEIHVYLYFLIQEHVKYTKGCFLVQVRLASALSFTSFFSLFLISTSSFNLSFFSFLKSLSLTLVLCYLHSSKRVSPEAPPPGGNRKQSSPEGSPKNRRTSWLSFGRKQRYM